MGQQSYPNLNGPEQVAPALAQAPKARTNWGLSIILLLVGLLIGAAAGYFGADFFIFGPKLDTAAKEKTQLSSRITTLENQVAQLQQGTGGTTTNNTTPGTGTAPTLNGITADPQTADWLQYSDTEHHVSFKYPSDYEVVGYQNSGDLAKLDDDKVFLGIGIVKKGDSEPAGLIYTYTPEGNSGSRGDGPTHRELALFTFPSHLPTAIAGVPAGAGVAPGVTESPAILNGVDGTKLTALEGSGTTPTVGGATYTGYLLENKFGNTYLTSACNSKQATQQDIVGCLFLTTIEIK